MLHFRHIFLLTVLLIFIGCKPHVVREAEVTLAEADSLRVHGIPPTDSARLAQTVADLHPWRYIYPTDYAKANYYYGYLLRAKGNYPAAMECFINATHAHTKDYLLLGRVYANMANMCQLDEDYDLAYKIYEKSHEQFAKSGNSIMYYYSLNNMAIQRAFQQDKNAVEQILSQIESECTDSAILNKILETRALVSVRVQEYDSAIMYINQLQKSGYHEPAGHVIKAQSFWYLSQNDSALFYAQIAMSCPCNKEDSINMMYITSHNDPSVGGDSILVITSERADKQVEYTHAQEQLAHAVEILEQSMKPNYKWVYGAAATLFIIGVILTIILFVTKRHRAAKQMQLKQMETRIAENQKLLELHSATIEEQLTANCRLLREGQDIRKTLQWQDYNAMCCIVDNRLLGLATQLQQLPSFNEENVRFCILEFISLQQKDIAEIMYYSPKSIGRIKERIAAKLDIHGGDLHDFLWKKMCQKHDFRPKT